MTPMTSPTAATVPCGMIMRTKVPLTGAGSPTAALSVSSSTTTSSAVTTSPSDLRQAPIWTEVIDSPTAGTCRLTAIGVDRLRYATVSASWINRRCSRL